METQILSSSGKAQQQKVSSGGGSDHLFFGPLFLPSAHSKLLQDTQFLTFGFVRLSDSWSCLCLDLALFLNGGPPPIYLTGRLLPLFALMHISDYEGGRLLKKTTNLSIYRE